MIDLYASFVQSTTVECVALAIAVCGVHQWLSQDWLLYKRVILYGGALLSSYFLGCSLLYGILLHITPAILVGLFFLHYRSIARMHAAPSRIFAQEIRATRFWLQDLTKAQLYAHYAGKNLVCYLMKHESAYLLFRHDMPLHMPLLHQFLTLFVEGVSKEAILLVDSHGHIRSLNPQKVPNQFLGQEIIECFFDSNLKTFSVHSANHAVNFLSASQAAVLLEKLILNKDPQVYDRVQIINEKDAHHFSPS